MYLRHLQLIILFLAFFASFAVSPPTIQAATMFNVTAMADTATSDGSCTLREAVLAANGSPANADCGSDSGGPYSVSFTVNGTITLGAELPTIERNMTIDGAGHSVTVSGNNTVPVFTVMMEVTLNLQNLTVANGYGSFGGGMQNLGMLNVSNCTISGNSATGSGGAIFSHGTLTVTNSTISGNGASSGGGINCSVGTMTLVNSIIANGGVGGNCFGACTGSHNLVDDNTCGAGFTNSLSINLGPQGDYGGGTLTIPLLPGSAAIDAGDSTTCADVATVDSLDQRGIPRPAGRCDIGAFESRGFTLAKTGGDNQGASMNSWFATPLQVSLNEAGGAGLPGALVTFTAPSSGPSTTPAIFTAITGPNSVASATVAANGTLGGPYSVTASVPGATSVNFSLTNLPLATLTIAFAGNGSGMVTSTRG